uniref:HAD family hydrolase n=1 Tax=Agathobacter sp. TaxID=2021311 RepID=UPI004057828D
MIIINSILEVENYIDDVDAVIFDLDDTLYSEKDYVRSGYKAVGEYLGETSLKDELWKYFEEGKKAIDEILQEKGLIQEKENCLKVYRNHMPDIELYDGVKEIIKQLIGSEKKVGIITDGRVQGQRNKITALGLDKLIKDIIITDELGGEQFRKPNPIAFEIIQHRWRIPFQKLVYIGDNLKKDFQAPKQLGMKCLYFCNKDGLYFDKFSNL